MPAQLRAEISRPRPAKASMNIARLRGLSSRCRTPDGCPAWVTSIPLAPISAAMSRRASNSARVETGFIQAGPA